jgi:hypothetical protein
MQLSEIELTKIFKKWSGNKVDGPVNIILDSGWKLMGGGVEAAVAMHPNREYVLKLFPKDSNYRNFVEYAKQHRENPHLPRFSRYIKPVPGTDWSYVRMEELKEIGAGVFVAGKKMVNDHLAEALYIRYTELSLHVNMNSFLSMLDKRIKKWIKRIESGKISYEELCDALQITPADAYWKQAVHDIAVTKMGQRIDLHPENIMLRGSTLVITDPVI